jgi:hypothetical protein
MLEVVVLEDQGLLVLLVVSGLLRNLNGYLLNVTLEIAAGMFGLVGHCAMLF